MPVTTRGKRPTSADELSKTKRVRKETTGRPFASDDPLVFAGLLDGFLKEMNWRVVPNRADGNCFYEALTQSAIVKNSEWAGISPRTLRDRIVTFGSLNPQIVVIDDVVPTTLGLLAVLTETAYWEKQGDNGAYASKPALIAASHLLDISIKVWDLQSNGVRRSPSTINGSGRSQINLLHRTQPIEHFELLETEGESELTSRRLVIETNVCSSSRRKQSGWEARFRETLLRFEEFDAPSEGGKFIEELFSLQDGFFDAEHTNEFSNVGPDDNRSLIRMARLLESSLDNGDIRKCSKILNHTGLADLNSTQALGKLLSKYPKAKWRLPNCERLSFPSDIEIDEEELVKFIKSFRRGAAKSFNGLSSDNYQSLIRKYPDCIPKLAKLIGMIARGSFFSGSSTSNPLLVTRGVAIKKGDVDIRPISIDDFLNKAAAHFVNKKFKRTIADYCGEFQFGSEISGGPEILIHSLRFFLESNKDLCVLKIDISNAFNSINKYHILHTISSCELLHGIYNYAKFILLSQRKIYYEKKIFCTADTGVAQGNSVSAGLFNLGQAEALKKVHILNPSVKIFSYFDDHYVVGSPDLVAIAANDLNLELQKIDLSINFSKCDIFSFNRIRDEHLAKFNQLGFNFTCHRDGVIVLGAPIGSNHFMSDYCMVTVDKIKSQLIKINTIATSIRGFSKALTQTAFAIARMCCPQQLNYLLRTVPCDITCIAGRELDSAIKKFIYSITDSANSLDYNCSDEQRENVHKFVFASIENGGCGFRYSEKISEAAYIGSLTLCLKLISEILPNLRNELSSNDNSDSYKSFTSTISGFRDRFPDSKLVNTLSIDNCWNNSYTKVQKSLSDLIDIENSKSIIFPLQSDETSRLKKLYLSNRDSFASLWLTASPAVFQHRMQDDVFKLAFKNRIGLPILNVNNIKCKCGKELDVYGLHHLCCTDMDIRSKIRNPAHRKLRNTLSSVILNCIPKHGDNASIDKGEPRAKDYFRPRAEDNIPDSDFDNVLYNSLKPPVKRRGDIGINNINYKNYKNILIDVTFSANNAQFVRKYGKAGDAAELGVASKHKFYNKHFLVDENHDTKLFIFAAENDGAIAKETKEFIDWLLYPDGDPIDDKFNLRIRQTLSVCLQRIRAEQLMFTLNKIELLSQQNNVDLMNQLQN
ncbi:MAG: reverse transcriptase domain-containing protein [Candidatus Pacearchaeota archaeon]